jgi:hypothetical protein
MPVCKILIDALVYAPSISPQGRQMTSISPLYRRYRTIEAKAEYGISATKSKTDV